MSFINTQIEIGDLPASESVRLQPIDPSFLKVLRIEWAIVSFILLAVATLFVFLISSIPNVTIWPIVFGVAILISSVHITTVEKSFMFKAFAIREKDVIYQKGWLIRSMKVCPFNRIQNCSVQMGPLERRYGLASLIIFTAGSEGADMRIPGLKQEEADRLRNFILEKIHSEKNEAV